MLNTARNASCGISTRPTRFMRRLPSRCLSRSFRLREISPPVALGRDVLSQSRNSFTGDDLRADCSLQGYFKLLARDKLLESLDQRFAASVRLVAMHDDRQRIDWFAATRMSSFTIGDRQ